MGEYIQRPLLIWTTFLCDTQVLAMIFCKTDQLFDDLVFLGWIDAGMWMDLVHCWAPVLLEPDSMHVLHAAK